jgi:hypothetical protein
MPKICYRKKNFSPDRVDKIEKANVIIAEYAAQGFELTLRQLYYQFVSRGFIPNNQREYKNLGDVINDARLAGQIDWESIVDRTRNLSSLAHWDAPTDIISACAKQFRIDKWATQPRRVEVWIEKDALVGVIEGVCQSLDVPFFSCRGYTSQSEMWSAAMRLRSYWKNNDQDPLVLHFGDHDPSGIDMTRDIQDRLQEFAFGTAGHKIELRRLALNMPQVQQYNPPPNPAKITDSRAEGYIAEHGDESWELDALEPQVIADLIRNEIMGVRDADKWDAAVEEEDEHKRLLSAVSDKWDEITQDL